MKRILGLVLILCLITTTVPLYVFAVDEAKVPDPETYPDYADLSYGALYAHATLGGSSKQTWQRWHKDVQGINFEKGIRYFFLPSTADDNQIEIYNNYENAVAIGDVVIEPYTAAFVDYKEGEPVTVLRGKGTTYEKEYQFVVLKSDAEASVYVNDNTGSYVDASGKTQNTDLWSFLVKDKENSVADSMCAIVDKNGTFDTTLKKIKGRGNTNWKETDKKPFNLTFYDKTDIGGVVDKKFSFVSNAKDTTLLRNSIMYDLADSVGNPYASDQSFIDFYVNGVYRGSYIACQKIDMGKNSVVSLKDTSDDVNTDFNFLVEVDVWNYKSDVYFVSDKGYHVVLKTPDLEDYDETDPSMKAKYDFISSTYQRLEDALYKGTLADIEKICDLESLASQYLLQEFGKNCDGGYTSTFFTYNSAEDKFYAAPIWDCDSDLGAVDCVRDGCTASTIDHKGWVTRLATYRSDNRITTVNPLGQAFYVEGKSSDGKTFEEICSDLWQRKFLSKINVLLGKAETTGRLRSIDDYAASIEKSAYINYVMWDFMWLCGQKNKSLNKEYTEDYAGELQYLKDWTKARKDWMSLTYGSGISEETTTTATTDTTPVPTTNVTAPVSTSINSTTAVITDATESTVVTSVNTDPVESTSSVNITTDATEPTETSVLPTDATDATEPTESSALLTDVTEASTPSSTENTTELSEPTVPSSSQNGTTDAQVASTPAESATVTISNSSTAPVDQPLVFGDVNLDGRVNIKDATTLQKHLAKLLTLNDRNLSVADTNRDGRVTIKDATTIQKKIANLISWD